MKGYEATTLVRDGLFYILAVVLCSMVLLPEVQVAMGTLKQHGRDILILGAIVLTTSGVIQVIQRVVGEVALSRLVGIALSVIVLSNCLLLLHHIGLFSGLEKLTVFVICLFGIFNVAWQLGLKYWRYLPGMSGRVMLVGNGELANEMRQLIDDSNGRFSLRGFIECRPEYDRQGNVLPMGEQQILQRAIAAKAEKVVVSLAERRGAFPLQEMLNCKLSGIEVMDAQQFYELVNRKLMLEKITPSWFIFASGFRINGVRRFIKRTMDVVISILGLILAAPLMAIVAVAVKAESTGPVLFRQIRVGHADNEFVIYKFRTMGVDAEKSGAVWAKENDPRVTRLGNILRKTRIDEIPQLFNVLLGEMSLVGPRPERPEFIETLRKQVPYYSERHFVKPGITGWAQVSYPYGASVEDALEKLRYDLYYIKNYSLWFDFIIMFKTVGVVLNKMGR